MRGFWPVWTILFGAAAIWLSGGLDLLPANLRIGFVAFVALAAGGALAWGAVRWRRPTKSEAIARIDRHMAGRPLSALGDMLAAGEGDAVSGALWQQHQVRMMEQSRAARAVWPDLRVAEQDPYGLRFVAVLMFAVAVLFAPAGGPALISNNSGVAVSAPEAVWEGWIEPPAYTGRPSLYLADVPRSGVEVPVGSRLTVRFYGVQGLLSLRVSVAGPVPDGTAMEHRLEISETGEIEIVGADGAQWQVTVLEDAAPEVALNGPLETSADGRMTQEFVASDDYGVVSGEAQFALDLTQVDRRHGKKIAPEPRAPIVVDLPMPFRGDRAEVAEALVEDFSRHPFANLPVTLELLVEDDREQRGQSAPMSMVLPGRRFFEPVARAVIEQRGDLLWNRENAGRVAQILRAISNRPEGVFGNETAYLRLRVAIRELEALIDGQLTDDGVAGIAEALWVVAEQLEDGSLADARERLRRAQERLSEAMRNGANDAEIAELMEELRDAIDDYTRMLAQEGAEPEDGERRQAEGERQELSGDQLQAMLDRIQELMEQGRMAEAEQLMQRLNQMLENMRVTEGEGGQSQGQQAMRDLGDTLREQQELSDEAFRDLQDRFNGRESPQQDPGSQSGEQQGQQGQQGGQGADSDRGDGEGEGSLADRQEALRQELERQRGRVPLLDGEAAERAERSLERAEGAMDRAEEALRGDRLAEALDQQAEAMDALREGMRDLGQALADNRDMDGQGSQQGAAEGAREPNRRDPLGREMGRMGQQGTDEEMLEGGIPVDRRAEEILRELRDRAGDRTRPEMEQDYLRRLLERF